MLWSKSTLVLVSTSLHFLDLWEVLILMRKLGFYLQQLIGDYDHLCDENTPEIL